jgi:mitochondrial fission protein ELM1
METHTATGPGPVIWALHDGHAGNARQAMALAHAVARLAAGSVTEIPLALRAPLDRLPPWAWAMGRAREGGWPFTGLSAGAEALVPPWPALVIGCGRRAAPFTAAIRQLGGARAVQILAPQMRLAAFDAVIAPRHDRLRGAPVIETLGALNDLDGTALEAEAARWSRRLAHLPTPRVAVLVGGASRSADFGARTLQRLCDALTHLAIDGAGLMVTPSRRTPPAVADRLADTIAGVGGWMWGGVGENPYPGILGLADAVLVTADSVNMASEAAWTGKPVLVLPVDRLSGKLARFHDSLAEHGASRPFAGTLEFWRYPPLRETDRIAERVARLLAPA